MIADFAPPNRTAASLSNAQELLRQFGDDRAMLERYESGDAIPAAIAAEVRRLVPSWRITATALRQWEELGKQVLAVDERVLARISTAVSAKIHPAVLRALPYIDPLIVFPTPVEVTAPSPGERMELLGFIVTAAVLDGGDSPYTLATGSLCHSNDPQASALRINCVFRVVDLRSGEVGHEFDYLSVDLHGEPYTMGELVDRVVSRFVFAPGTAEGTRAARTRFLRESLRTAVAALLYLCSTTLDVERVPRKAVAKASPAHSRQPLSLLRVGWKTGEALSRLRALRQDSTDPSQQGGPGHEQDPQHRRAHVKTVWTGPGSRIPKIAYVEPYWTHVEKLEGYRVNTIHRVL